LGNTVKAYLDANMAEYTSAHVFACLWRLAVLVGAASFAACYALFRLVLPVGAWSAAVQLNPASLFIAILGGIFAMALTIGWRARKLRIDNLRMRIAINNMSQG